MLSPLTDEIRTCYHDNSHPPPPHDLPQPPSYVYCMSNAQPKPLARLDFPIADHEHLHLDARRGTQPRISLLRHNREAKSRADLVISGRCDPLAGQGKSSLGCRRGGSTHCGNIQIAEDGMFSPLFDRGEVLLSSVLCRRQAGVLSSWSAERSGMRDPSRPSSRDSTSDQFRLLFTRCPDRTDMDRITTKTEQRSTLVDSEGSGLHAVRASRSR